MVKHLIHQYYYINIYTNNIICCGGAHKKLIDKYKVKVLDPRFINTVSECCREFVEDFDLNEYCERNKLLIINKLMNGIKLWWDIGALLEYGEFLNEYWSNLIDLEEVYNNIDSKIEDITRYKEYVEEQRIKNIEINRLNKLERERLKQIENDRIKQIELEKQQQRDLEKIKLEKIEMKKKIDIEELKNYRDQKQKEIKEMRDKIFKKEKERFSKCCSNKYHHEWCKICLDIPWGDTSWWNME